MNNQVIENKENSQVVSKQRVSDHGEVYTAKREVDAMLDLVQHECERIDSRFLEPACGTGNFLVEILSRKLKIISQRYSKSQLEYERNSILAVGSIYGIELLPDNINLCQARLLEIFSGEYKNLYKDRINLKCLAAVKFILSQNILHGDALTLQTVETETKSSEPIIFSEWTLVNGSLIKRRDFIYAHLLDKASHREIPLFSDLDEEAYIPEPVKDYPLVHFLELGNG